MLQFPPTPSIQPHLPQNSATGHDSIITDPAAKTRLEGLKNTWLSQTANHALKTALSTNNLNVTRA